MPENALYSVEKLSPEAYEALVDSLPQDLYVPFEQASIWAELDKNNPARSHYGLFAYRDEQENLIAIASIYHFVRRIRQSLVLLNGPVYVAERTSEVERRLIETMKHQVEKDPSVNPLYIRLTLKHPSVIPHAVQSLERGGFEREVVVDLGRTPEELKASFSKTAKHRINKSSRSGVEVREITENRAEFFAEHCYPILLETAARDSFVIMSSDFYEKSLSGTFGQHTRLYVAYAPATAESPWNGDKIPVGWMITNEYHYRGCYYFGGSTARAQECGAMFALMFRILQELNATGNLAVGLTGISSERYPELKGVEQFKLKFSKRIEDYPRLFDVPLNPPRYAAVSLMIKAGSQGPGLIKSSVAKARGGITRGAKALISQARKITKNDA